jgi:hypothetical protein
MFVALAAREFIAKFLIASWPNRFSSEIKWLVECLQEKLYQGTDSQSTNNFQQQMMIMKHRVSVLDIVRILLSTNIEVGPEILCTTRLFSICVEMAEKADQTVCKKMVDVINGIKLNPRYL